MTKTSTTVGKNSLEEMKWPSQSARVQNAVIGCSLKNDRMTLIHFQGEPFSITVIQVYATNSNVKKAKVDQFYEDIQHFQELMPKRCVFHHRGLQSKSRKLRDI